MMTRPTLRLKLLLLIAAVALSFLLVRANPGGSGAAPKANTLRDFPLRIQNWTGEDVRLANEVLEKLGVDAYIMRRYSSGGRNFWLYIGFYSRQEGGKTIHSPKHCYPGSGWMKLDASTRAFQVTGWNGADLSIPVNRYLLEKDGEKELVYYWYQTGDSAVASEIHAAVNRVVSAVLRNRTDGALIRLSARIPSGTGQGEEEFARVIPEIYALLKDHIPG